MSEAASLFSDFSGETLSLPVGHCLFGLADTLSHGGEGHSNPRVTVNDDPKKSITHFVLGNTPEKLRQFRRHGFGNLPDEGASLTHVSDTGPERNTVFVPYLVELTQQSECG